MTTRAMELGARLIELARALNDDFADRSVTRESLDALLWKIAAVPKDLRLTHLEMHLHTPGLLTVKQIAAYNRLRGYRGGADHGANPPPPWAWRLRAL